MATEAPSVLIDTKLNPPILRDAVDRPRLVQALAESTQRVKLVRAPAGWGKSTLVAAWSTSLQEPRPFAWLALDEADDEPIRFWTYVIQSLRGLDPGIGTTSMPLLVAPGTDVSEHVVPALLNELAELPEPAVFALDDYHEIASAVIHAQVALFVERLPPTLHVSLTTRSEPPLPLARWRARGELLEIDLANLRFEPGEANELLNGILQLRLDSNQVASLCDRTEGWAAGLFLAEGLTSIEGALAIVRTAYLWELGDARGALSSGQEALDAEAEDSPWRGIGAATIGLAHGALGDLDEAQKWSLEYARVGRAFGQHLNETSGLGSAALFAAEAGDWDAADERARRSLAISLEHGINEHWSGAACHLALGLVLEQRDELEEAERQIERAATLDRRGAGPIELGWSLTHLSRLQAARWLIPNQWA